MTVWWVIAGALAAIQRHSILQAPSSEGGQPGHVLTLARFFAKNGVYLQVKPLLAEHSPTFDTCELQLVFQQAADTEKAERIFSDHQTVDERILRLFQQAETIQRRQLVEMPAGERAAYLTARGPVLLLGRRRPFPREFLSVIDDELRDAGRTEGVFGRFDFPCSDSFAKQDEYRRFHGAYSGTALSCESSRGRYRSLAFAYGSDTRCRQHVY